MLHYYFRLSLFFWLNTSKASHLFYIDTDQDIDIFVSLGISSCLKLSLLIAHTLQQCGINGMHYIPNGHQKNGLHAC